MRERTRSGSLWRLGIAVLGFISILAIATRLDPGPGLLVLLIVAILIVANVQWSDDLDVPIQLDVTEDIAEAAYFFASDASSKSTAARAIQRWTSAVWRGTNSPKAAASPALARAISFSSGSSGKLVDTRGPVSRGAGILRLALMAGVGSVLAFEAASPLSRIEVPFREKDTQTNQLAPEFVAQPDRGDGSGILIESDPLDWEVRPFSGAGDDCDLRHARDRSLTVR